MKRTIYSLFLLSFIVISLSGCGVLLDMPIPQGVVKDDFNIKLNNAGKQVSIQPNRFFHLDSLGLVANKEAFSANSKTLLAAYTDGNIGNNRLMQNVYDITLTRGGKNYYGKMAFFEAPSSARNQGVTSYYQISIGEKYFMDASDGRVACTFEYWKKGANGKYITWIIWLSDAPLKTTIIEDRKLKNTTYLQLGLAMPTGVFGQKYGNTDFYNNMFHPMASTGFSLELGRQFYFNRLSLGVKNARLGIDAGFHVTYNGSADAGNSYTGLGFKIGPVFSYYLGKNTLVDVFVKINPTLISTNGLYAGTSDSTMMFISPDGTPLAIKKSIGAKLRSSHLLLSAEYNFGKVNYGTDYSGIIPTDVKVGSSMFLLSIGLCW